MRSFGHPIATPCPPSRDDLIVGAGGIRTDGDGDTWCCHASPHLRMADVGRQRAETERARAGRGGRAAQADVDRLTPTPDPEGQLPALPDVVWDVHSLTPPGDD